MDKVNPAHYKQGASETIDVIESAVADPASYLHGSVIKYVCRADYKGDRVNDLKKARWFLDRLIRFLDKTLTTVTIDGVEYECHDVELSYE